MHSCCTSEGCSKPQSTTARISSCFSRKSLNPDAWIPVYEPFFTSLEVSWYLQQRLLLRRSPLDHLQLLCPSCARLICSFRCVNSIRAQQRAYTCECPSACDSSAGKEGGDGQVSPVVCMYVWFSIVLLPASLSLSLSLSCCYALLCVLFLSLSLSLCNTDLPCMHLLVLPPTLSLTYIIVLRPCSVVLNNATPSVNHLLATKRTIWKTPYDCFHSSKAPVQ